MPKNPAGPLWDNPAPKVGVLVDLGTITDEQIQEFVKLLDTPEYKARIKKLMKPYRKINPDPVACLRILD